DLAMWNEVAQQLAKGFTVLRYDHRGHGRSPMTSPECTIEDLADEAAALIEREAGSEVHFVGLSMGGMVAQQVAVRHPQLAACAEAVSRIDFFATNPLIACPALVIAGTQDEATPIAMSHAICNAISGAELATLDAAHLSAVERPAEFAGLVAGFISRI